MKVLSQSLNIYYKAPIMTNLFLMKSANKNLHFSQRINKFYIAYQAGFNDKTMLDRLAQSVKIFEKGLETLNLHKFLNYDQEFAFVRLKNSWAISKKFYEGMEKGDLTLIVSVSTDHLMSYLDKIISLENKS
jgi:predicted ATP-grasp superfamily ATP-dependent carboligase